MKIAAKTVTLCSIAGVALIAITCAGCNVEKVASVVESHEAKLGGPNAAIGGVSYLRERSGSDINWDRHITSCKSNSGPDDISFGNGGLVLTIHKGREYSKVVLQGPDGPVTFDQAQCSSLDLQISPHAPDSREMDGSISAVCQNEHGSLNSSIQFHRCGP